MGSPHTSKKRYVVWKIVMRLIYLYLSLSAFSSRNNPFSKGMLNRERLQTNLSQRELTVVVQVGFLGNTSTLAKVRRSVIELQ